jgi:hypothetical protein
MAEANAEDRNFAGHVADEADGDAGFVRRTGTRRKDDALGCQGFNFFGRELVIAADDNVSAEFTDVLDEVEGEGIVVVENENHLLPV